MENNYEQEEQDKFTFLNSMQDQQIEALRRQHKSSEGIIIFGITGAGKTTVFHILNELELVGKRISGKIRIDAKQKTHLTNPINHTVLSAHEPAKILFQDGVHWVDFPGLLDTISDQRQIQNAVCLRDLLQVLKRIKIIIVIQDSTRIDQIKQLLINLNQMFGRKLNQQHAKNCMLLVTKVKKQKLAQKYLKDRLSALEKGLRKQKNSHQLNQNHINQNQINFFTALYENSICIFYEHQQEEEVNSQELNANLRKIVNQKQYLTHDSTQIILTMKAQFKIVQIFEQLQEIILKIYENLVNTIKIVYSKEQIANKSNEELKKILGTLEDVGKLQFVMKWSQICQHYERIKILISDKSIIFQKFFIESQKIIIKMHSILSLGSPIKKRDSEINFTSSLLAEIKISTQIVEKQILINYLKIAGAAIGITTIVGAIGANIIKGAKPV